MFLRAIAIAGLACGLAFADEPLVEFNTDFPGGNLLVQANEGKSPVVAPDLRGGRDWFYWYFEAKASKPGRVTFVFPEKVAGFKNGAIGNQGPAVSTDGGKTWAWAGRENVRENAFFHDFSKAGETIRYAVTIPYTESNLSEFLEKQAGNSHLQTGVLTQSNEGRDVELLEIGQRRDGRRPVIVTARHHAVETMASYVLEGFLAEA
ncbi:MAG: hypothetical protein HKN23_17380, partial [Verrucomicrobiales bacterium]|nr:hypothetical protein [Verrucomicrobiales bacterium]